MQLEEYVSYLKNEKQMSPNSLEAYKHDLMSFERFVKSRGVSGLEDVTNTDVIAYLLQMKEDSRSASTINRKLASVRSFYKWMIEKNGGGVDPTANIKSPKVERKEIDYLSIEDIDKLMETPDDSVKGKRDRAILELMYATGIRVNEVIDAELKDVNLRIGFFTCRGEGGKARIVPIGRPARAALEEYIYDSREIILSTNNKEPNDGDDEEKGTAALTDGPLFLNHRGAGMTRQGLWKILKEYGEKVGIEKRITPHILRNSFAVHMVQNGADLKSLQELMGHEDPAAMQIYMSVTRNRIKDVYDKTHPRA